MKKVNLTALLLAGAALTITALPAQAQNADEVSALRAQVQELLARIEKLEKAPAAVSGAATGQATPPVIKDVPLVAADAYKAPQVTQSGNSKVKLTLSGQIGRSVLFVDDGFDTDTLHGDNATASSRIRLAGQAKLDDNWTAGTDIELEASSASTRNIGIGNDGGSNFSMNERKIEFWVQHKAIGRLWVGQGDTATNTSSESDLSGTGTLLGYSDIGQSFGGVAFRNRLTRANGPTVNNAFNNFDGLHREDRVRYDTPSFGGGFQLSTSVTQGGAADGAVRYNGKVGDTEIAAAVGYADNKSRTGFDTQTNGSVSVKFASGFNVTGAAGTRDLGPRNSDFWYSKLGYIAKLTSLGNSAFAVDYYKQEDFAVAGADSKAWGLSYVQTVDAFAADFYLGFRNHEYNTPTADFRDVYGFISGARVRF
ncbi:porin [Niveispirillum irakense]|uniref:porin n=1 Tax=Niveispirillum irakense TaxID=34011 RepID=UPI00042069FE|nr:porin [Niveispirillum irakense]